MEEIIGRKREIEILESCVNSGSPEFIAIYGRRRVGKTFLVKNFFDNKFDFYMTGSYGGNRQDHLRNFKLQMKLYSGKNIPVPKDWLDAFFALNEYLTGLKKDIVTVFIDELPWLDTPKSNFIRALELFWNQWASNIPNLKLIVCGSATTWMTNKLLGDKGGLHNRVTRSIHLSPFNLAETEEYLQWRGVNWDRYTIVEAYMIFGGIPYYLKMIDKKYGLPGNVDFLLFQKDSELSKEYDILFHSLFSDAEMYKDVVNLLSGKMKGMTRKEIVEALPKSNGGTLTEVLRNLVNCDFISTYSPFGKSDRETLYQLSDHYCLFYNKYVRHYNGRNAEYWSSAIDSSSRRAWAGYAFEQVCLGHVQQIKKALGINGVQTDVCSWTGGTSTEKTQIDLLLDRRDHIINICEMKFYNTKFEITKEYAEKLRNRKELFRKATKTNKALHITLVTTYGLVDGIHASTVQNVVTMDDLFN